MEGYDALPSKEISPLRKLEARFRGAMDVYQDRLADFNDLKVNFINETLRRKFTEEELQGSASYHLLNGSGTSTEMVNSPISEEDPAFKDIKNFLENDINL